VLLVDPKAASASVSLAHVSSRAPRALRSRQAEEADGCPNFLLLHSLAGGSGSGMGSRLAEHLRDAYPLSYLAAASIAPRAAGDTPMQSLNAVMALSFLQVGWRGLGWAVMAGGALIGRCRAAACRP
jgi:hypothetical protein